ncbi:hypothetical protein BV22DRAFT_1107961 [Leucogyrophana mollusca]|uniref:Uncharacterized protein n=1 Tax=Leucogyrophana mollusca TaxID=85980 RepID=A0ACB8B3U4_9AGAM|nr:hypothetical protein BV22DRAFT_1107961 [Leucogyrophana mollusca]
MMFRMAEQIAGCTGESFKCLCKDLESSQLLPDYKIDVHKTLLHPLPAMNIDESMIVGNGKVVKAVLDKLGIKESLSTQVKIFAGDQLSIVCLWTLVNIRTGQEGGFAGLGWGAWMPGLFHVKIADMHKFLVTHWGKPNAGTRNPGCLAFHNTLLHCLLLVSERTSLEDYTSTVDDWSTLCDHAKHIYKQYTNPDIVAELRWQQQFASKNDINAPRGDMIFENAVLYLRDGLLLREFTDAVKMGDSGQVVLVRKIWALSFQGNRAIVMNKWLLNPMGWPNLFVEVDLVQEHMNFWVKNFYQAHGSLASWHWLKMIAQCPMDLSHNIPLLMSSLSNHKVYKIKNRHTLDDNDAPVVNVITAGFEALTNSPSSPLDNLNHTFARFQFCRHLKPIVGCPSAVYVAPQGGTIVETPNANVPATNSAGAVESVNRSETQHETYQDNDDDDTLDEEGSGDFERSAEEVEEITLEHVCVADVSLDMDMEEDMSCYEHSSDISAEAFGSGCGLDSDDSHYSGASDTGSGNLIN